MKILDSISDVRPFGASADDACSADMVASKQTFFESQRKRGCHVDKWNLELSQLIQLGHMPPVMSGCVDQVAFVDHKSIKVPNVVQAACKLSKRVASSDFDTHEK